MHLSINIALLVIAVVVLVALGMPTAPVVLGAIVGLAIRGILYKRKRIGFVSGKPIRPPESS